MASVIERTAQKLWVNGYPGMEIDLGNGAPVFSDEEFLDFCLRNPDARIERDSNGEIEVMAPTYSETGEMNSALVALLWLWTKKDGTGRAFESSSGFTLDNGALRAPDASWVSFARWNALSDKERSGFAKICPDFAVELRSQTDSVPKLMRKMDEYMQNGALLGWLIDPLERKLHIYRPNAETEILDNPAEVSGEPTLPGFILTLSEIWG
jgi:Uma2 family endonuclease